MSGTDAGAIVLSGVSKRYGRAEVLSDVDLSVAPGTVVGLVGPNGAGKSTLLRVIAGLSLPTSGDGAVGGRPFSASCRAEPFVGLVADTSPFIGHLSARTNLRLLARIRGRIGRAEVDAALEEVGLDPGSRKAVSRFSHGMRQRLSLAQAIMEHPPLLLLDEPTNGLDTEGRLLLRRVVSRQASEGATVLLSSHSLSDVEAVCGRVFLVEGGRVRELRLSQGEGGGEGHEMVVKLAETPPCWVVENMGLRTVGGGRYRLAVSGDVPEAVRLLVQAGARIEEVRPYSETLHDAYLSALRTAS